MRKLIIFTSIMLVTITTHATDNPSQDSVTRADAEAASKTAAGHITAQQIVQRIKEKRGASTLDPRLTTKKPDTEVTGIVTTLIATWDVLQRTAASGKNFVITCEPSFYKQSDSPSEDDKLAADKQAFIEKHRMVICRLYGGTDVIMQGMVHRLGWEKHLRPDTSTSPASLVDLPETTLQSLAKEMKGKLHATVVRVVGKPEMKVKAVAMIPEVGALEPTIRMLQRDDVDVLVTGQTPEWQAVEYAQDAIAAGKPKALIMLGHVNSAEAGMEDYADVLREFITDVPVEFIAAGDPFWSPPAGTGIAGRSHDSAPKVADAKRPTARQIVERIQQNVYVKQINPTRDTYKAGNPDTEVTGIATTFMSTLDMLQRASASGKNFVITHEPTFYSDSDNRTVTSLEDNKLVAEKLAFIEKHGMVVWRFHDYWHARRPDGIVQGMVRGLGWEKYLRPGAPPTFDLPETTLENIANEVRDKLHATNVRVVGNPQMKIKTAGLQPGAGKPESHIGMLQRDDVQLLLTGETPEWRTIEYARDAVASGRPKALIVLGHANSEKAGMENCADWLKGFVPEVPVEFIPSGDPFWSP